MRKALLLASLLATLTGTQQAALAQMAVAPAKAGINIADYGTQVDVVSEDFSKFASGSEQSPDFSTNVNTETTGSKRPYFENVASQYTTQAGWGAAHAYPAGGSVCLYSTDEYNQAHINTPIFDASGHDGVFVIRFRARLLEDVSNYSGLGLQVLDFSKSETDGSWQILTTIKDISTEWRTFELVVHNGTSRMLVNVTEESQKKVLIDDMQVLQVNQFVGTPHLLRHYAYMGTSFRPRWNRVEGAESYIVNVYNSDEEGTLGTPLVEDMQTTDTICTVRGLLPGNIYRYNVTAVAGSHRSIPTDNVKLYELATPVFNTTMEGNGDYEASWATVPNALYYNYYLYKETAAGQAGERVLIDEDFTGVTDQGDESKTWDETSIPEYGLQMQDIGYPKHLNISGWTATKWAPLSAGYVVVDGWNYFYDVRENVKDYDFIYDDVKLYAKIQTPELDLSKDNGKMHVSADLWGQLAEDNNDADNNYPAYQVNGIIALMNYDVNSGQYEMVESKHFDLAEKWTKCEADFTKGSENSKIMIMATDGPGLLFIDNIKLTQNYKEGETFSAPVLASPGNLTASVLFTLPSTDANYYQRVEAAAQRQVYWGTRQYVFYSRLTDPDPVYTAFDTAINGTQDNATTDMKARLEGDDIIVSGVSGKTVNVYTTGGTLVAKAHAHTDSVAMPVKTAGVFIVKAEGKTIKIAK